MSVSEYIIPGDDLVGGDVEVGRAVLPKEVVDQAQELMKAYRITYDQWCENAWRTEIERIKKVEKKEKKQVKR